MFQTQKIAAQYKDGKITNQIVYSANQTILFWSQKTYIKC